MGVLEKTCVACVSQHFGTAERKETAHFAHRRSAQLGNATHPHVSLGRVGWGGAWGAARVVQGSVGVTAGVQNLSAQSEPSIVGLIQAGDGCVPNPVFPIQMFLVVWLKGKEGGGGFTTHLVSFHPASPPFIHSDT